MTPDRLRWSATGTTASPPLAVAASRAPNLDLCSDGPSRIHLIIEEDVVNDSDDEQGIVAPFHPAYRPVEGRLSGCAVVPPHDRLLVHQAFQACATEIDQ